MRKREERGRENWGKEMRRDNRGEKNWKRRGEKR